MFYGSQEANAAYHAARALRKHGAEKNNPHPVDTMENWAFEDGWKVTDDQHDLIVRWFVVCKQAGDMMAHQPMTYKTDFTDFMKHNGPCTFEHVVVEGEGYDCEALPFYKIKSGDTLIDADGDELSASGHAGTLLTLMTDIVSGGYAISRENGFADPADMIMNGTQEQMAVFLEHVAHSETINPDDF